MGDVPVIELVGLSKAQRALIIADDNGAERWLGQRVARLELSGLGELGFDLSLTGFDALEIAALTSAGIGAIRSLQQGTGTSGIALFEKP